MRKYNSRDVKTSKERMYKILLNPVVTEKATLISEHNQVTFRVPLDANKFEIKAAIEEAELMAGCEISHVYAGIAGGHISGFNSHGIVAVKDHEVSQSDIDRVIDAARAIAIPLDREVIHILPREYIIDEQDGIRKHIKIFVKREPVRDLARKLEPADDIQILQALSGG